jgi:diguanylate cyclase (GGDEF)-like protein
MSANKAGMALDMTGFERYARSFRRGLTRIALVLPGWSVLFMATLFAVAQTGQQAPSPLRVLTTAREAHSMRSEDAARAYPVHLRAVVTYYDAYLDPRHGAVFVHDSTGGIFVAVPSLPVLPLHAGTEVDVTGVTGPGDFAPFVDKGVVRVIAQSWIVPRATPMTLVQLLAGGGEGQWVAVTGVVEAVRTRGKNTTIDLQSGDGPISAITPTEEGGDYSHLIDSRIIVHGNAAPLFNRYRQLIGVHLLFPSLAALTILERSPAAPYDLPISPIHNLLQFTPHAKEAQRAHVQGRVTLFWPGRRLCIEDASDGLCMQTAQNGGAHTGDQVDVAGFPVLAGFSPSMTNAIFRYAGKGVAFSPPEVTGEQALDGTHDADPVQVEGQLVRENLTAGELTLMLHSGNLLFTAILPRYLLGDHPSPWQEGTTLRVTGICSVKVDAKATSIQNGEAKPESFRILLPSLGGVEVLKTPPWWTPGHAFQVLALVVAVTFSAIVWILVLRHRVKEQTQVIRGSEERLRHLSEHDALTDLPNRVLLYDRLNSALERAKRFQTGLGLLMVDLDNFKEVNDSLGHNAGDQLLCQVAKRMCESVRKTDTVARFGGDEFIVLLSDLQTPYDAEEIAEKIVEAVSAPTEIGELSIPISASVGVCTFPQGGVDAAALLASVDLAMYHAKAKGRNGYRTFTPDMDYASIRK